MFSRKRETIPTWLLLLGLVTLISLPVIGQESVLSSVFSPAPLFSIVAPLTQDVVGGDVVFILKPHTPLVRADVHLVSSSSTFFADLSAENSYTASWPSQKESDGSYTFEFEGCDDTHCETRSVDVIVNNSSASSANTPPSSTPDDTPQPVLVDDGPFDTPLPADTIPDADAPRTTFSVSPSNFFGVFKLSSDDSSLSLRSTGDAFVVPPGSYDASSRFLHPSLSIALNNVVLDSDNVLFHLDENVIQSFSSGPDTYDVVYSAEVIVPYSFYLATLDFDGDTSLTTFACLNWSFSSHTCNVPWALSPTATFSSEFSSTSVVVGTARLRVPIVEPPIDINADVLVPDANLPDANVPTIPDANTPIADVPILVPDLNVPDVNVPEPPIPSFSIVSSNVPSTLSILFSNGDLVPFSWGTPIRLPQGTYSFDVAFDSGDIQSVFLQDTLVDRRAVLVTVDANIPPALHFDFNSTRYTTLHSVFVHADLTSASSRVTLFNPLFEPLFACSAWDVNAYACNAPWTPISFDGSAFSYAPSQNDFAIAFARPTTFTGPDINADVLVPSADANESRLVKAIWALKETHTNKNYFSAEDSRTSLNPLRSLFSSIDVSLQCDPARAPAFPTVPNSPVLNAPVFPFAEADSETPLTPTATPDIPSTTISPFYNPSNILFYSNEWEEALVVPESARKPEGEISCDGVSLTNIFEDRSESVTNDKVVYLGDSVQQVKQSLYVTNNTDTPQDRYIVVRFATTYSSLSTDAGPIRPSSRYQVIPSYASDVPPDININPPLPADADIAPAPSFLDALIDAIPFLGSPDTDVAPADSSSDQEAAPAPVLDAVDAVPIDSNPLSDDPSSAPASREMVAYNSALRFSDEGGRLMGTYDFSDLLQPSVSPDVVVHSRRDETIVETIIPVHVLPFETVYLDPILDLAYDTNYSIRWYGVANDQIGRTSNLSTFATDIRTPGIQFFDLDGNGYANDAIITSSFADVNTKTDVGAVWMILDVDKRNGYSDLNSGTNYNARWNGGMASDFIGYVAGSDAGVKIINADGNVRANDLLIGAAFADGNSTNVGAVYLILDIINKNGNFDLNYPLNYKASWYGTIASDQIANTNNSGDGMQIVNIDNNSTANDMLLLAANYDINSARPNVGAVFIMKDINRFSGVNNLALPSSYDLRITGQRDTDNLGSLAFSTDGVYLANLDDNTYANDLIIGASKQDAAVTLNNAGAIYMLLDVDKKVGTRDFNDTTKYNAKWFADFLTDSLGSTQNSGPGVFLMDADGNTGQSGALKNDMIISCYLCNAAGTDRGAIYFINDINKRSGDINLGTAANYVNRWVGAANTDEIGYTGNSGSAGIIIGDFDTNKLGVVNDMIIVSSLRNSATPATARTDNGSVILIKDFNTIRGAITLNDTNAPSNYSAQWIGSRASDFLGDAGWGTPSVQIVNLDGNLLANDMIISASRADTTKADTGAVWVIRDINAKNGNFDLNGVANDKNYNARWAGNDQNQLGFTFLSGNGLQIVNVDGNTRADDLLITSTAASTQGRVANGSIHLIKDISLKSGLFDLNVSSGYNLAWFGDSNLGRIGDTNRGGQGVRVVNLDNNWYANDLLIANPYSDGNFPPTVAANRGSLYVILDIDKITDGNYDLNVEANYYKKFSGSTLGDQVASAADSNDSFNVIDIDRNGYTNDIWVTSLYSDTNARINAGSIWIIRDVATDRQYDTFPPDVNVWRFDNFPDNAAFPIFDFTMDGNITIDFNVFDPDSNSLLVDINYSTAATPYTGTTIVDDVNISKLPAAGAWNCADTDFRNVTRCSVDWDISTVSDGNYWIHITVKDSNNQIDLNVSDRNVGIKNRVAPDVNIIKFDNSPDNADFKLFDYFTDGNLTIDFNVFDSDTNSLLVDLNYSTSSLPNTGTVIVDDINLSVLRTSGPYQCADTNFIDVTTCKIDWNIMSVADGNYWIHITVVDSNSQVDQNTSDRNVGVYNNLPPGPIDSNGFITVYTSSTTVDHVVPQGIETTPTLSIPSGRFVQDHNYLIFTSATLTGSTNAARVMSDVVHGTTPFQSVEEIQELPQAVGSTWTYSSFVVWQAVSGENINYQITCVVASTTCTVRNASMVVIDLNKFTRNYDWYYDENIIPNANMSDTFAANPGSSITFTPNGKSDYLILGNGQFLIDSAGNVLTQMELFDGSNQNALAQRDFEDLDDTSVLSVAHVLDTNSTSPKTYTLRFNGGTIHDHNSSRLFVLRMDALAIHDFNIVDENFNIDGVLRKRADLNITTPRDDNVVSFYAAAVRAQTGLPGSSQFDFIPHFDDTNLFSADGNRIRSWSQPSDPTGGDLLFNLTGFDLNTPASPSHSISTRLISETADASADAHSNLKAGVIVFSHRISGDLNLFFDNPSHDDFAYTSGDTFVVSGRAQCIDFNCGFVSTKLQYCAGSCSTYYDINSVAGTPLQLMSGTIPDTNADLNSGQWYDVNWTVKNNSGTTFELRLFATGSTAELQFTSSGIRTITFAAVETDYSFTLSLPSSGCTNGKGNITGGTSCQRGWIEATDTTGSTDENQVAPEGQTSLIPFFVYDNTGGINDTNIILDLNQNLPATLRLKASAVSTGYQAGCTGPTSVGCILLTTSTQHVGTAVLAGGFGTQDLNVWLWGDFVAATIGRNDVNVDSNGVSAT